ncbi:MAG: 2Fe-2S iron-sulfur cluster-binding protein [Mycobacteriaceae bacterium]
MSKESESSSRLVDNAYELIVETITYETKDSCSLTFSLPDGVTEKFSYTPGQFLTIQIPSDQTGSVARCYSLSSSPHLNSQLSITVKRTAAGYGSNWLCDKAKPGLKLISLPPAGVFTPKNLNENFLLLAAGSGITPLMSIIKSALTQGTGKIVLIYANRDENSVIFSTDLQQLTAQYPERLTVIHWLETVQGLPTVATLGSFLSQFSSYEVFICGPKAFMDNAKKSALELKIPSARIHTEIFKSLSSDPFLAAPTEIEPASNSLPVNLTVELDNQTHSLKWDHNTKLLDYLLSKEIDVPFSCREGHCSACACIMLKGKVRMEANEVLSAEDIGDGIILACQAYPESDDIEISYSQG